MFQYRITFQRTTTGTPAPICLSGTILYIVLDDGFPKYSVGGTTLDIDYIEVYVSGETTTQFLIVGDDGATPDYVDDVDHLAFPSSDPGRVVWSRDAADNLVLHFTPPANTDTVHQWTFGTDAPPVVLKVKVKRQQGANSGSCDDWPDIVIPPT